MSRRNDLEAARANTCSPVPLRKNATTWPVLGECVWVVGAGGFGLFGVNGGSGAGIRTPTDRSKACGAAVTLPRIGVFGLFDLNVWGCVVGGLVGGAGDGGRCGRGHCVIVIRAAGESGEAKQYGKPNGHRLTPKAEIFH